MHALLVSILTVVGALRRAAIVARCFRGALPPVDFRAVCFERAILPFVLIGYEQIDQTISALYIFITHIYKIHVCVFLTKKVFTLKNKIKK